MIDWLEIHEEYYKWFYKKYGSRPYHTQNSIPAIDELISMRSEYAGEYPDSELYPLLTESGKAKMAKKLRVITFDEWLNVIKNTKNPRRNKQNKK